MPFKRTGLVDELPNGHHIRHGSSQAYLGLDSLVSTVGGVDEGALVGIVIGVSPTSQVVVDSNGYASIDNPLVSDAQVAAKFYPGLDHANAHFRLLIPNNPSLAGLTLMTQWLTFDGTSVFRSDVVEQLIWTSDPLEDPSGVESLATYSESKAACLLWCQALVESGAALPGTAAFTGN